MSRLSPDDEPPPLDLLAAARRRLPPQVDVVELEGGDAMRVGPGAAIPVLAGALALSGCASSPGDVRAAAERSRSHVREVSAGVLSTLGGLGTPYGTTTGVWEGCHDIGGEAEYHVTGRLDPPDEASDASGGPPAGPGARRPLVVRVVDALADTGWRLEQAWPGDDPVTLQAVHDGVRVQISGYTSAPFVLFVIAGPCIEVGDLFEELFVEPAEVIPFPPAGEGDRS
ncbi:MAG: hypothetical protein ACRDV1_08985 [Actinomycetes bacterium]